jgi:hypothetical protein
MVCKRLVLETPCAIALKMFQKTKIVIIQAQKKHTGTKIGLIA